MFSCLSSVAHCHCQLIPRLKLVFDETTVLCTFSFDALVCSYRQKGRRRLRRGVDHLKSAGSRDEHVFESHCFLEVLLLHPMEPYGAAMAADVGSVRMLVNRTKM